MEQVPIVDLSGKVIGKSDRDKAHEEQLLHQAIVIMVFNSKNQVLLQLRKANKKQYPSFWAGSVNGHVTYGDTPDSTAIKEMKEELGVELEVEFVDKFHIKDDVENELVYVYKAKSDGPFDYEER